MLFVAWQFEIEDFLMSSVECDNVVAIKRLNSRLNALVDSFGSLNRSSEVILNLGKTGYFEVDPEDVPRLNSIAEQASEYLEYGQVRFGVGVNLKESWFALKAAAKRNKRVVLWDPSLAEDPTEEELSKAEMPQEQAPQDEQRPDPMQLVREALKVVKEQAPTLSQLKQAAPEAYNAVKAILQAMVAMSSMLPLQKSMSLPMPKKTPLKVEMTYPDPPAAVPSAGAVSPTKRKKSAGRDPQTKEPTKAKWHSVRSGMVTGLKGQAVSSRMPNVE